MNKISSAINCVNCREVIVSPVLLPCGCSICEKHTIDFDRPIHCCSCQIDHILPENGKFPPNKALSSILATHIDTKNIDQKLADAKKACSQLKELLESIEDILADPYNVTYEAIRGLMDVVQAKGDEMKLEIDKQIDQILSKLEEYHENCKINLSTDDYRVKSKEIREEKEEAGKLLSKWENILHDDTKLDQIEWVRVENESRQAIEWFECTLNIFKIDLLLGNFHMFCDAIEKYFGNIKIEPNFSLKYN
jgi:hypothetical protein